VSLAALLLIAYLIGAFPTAVLAGRLLRGFDIRTQGSGNAGATNTWRILGWKAGVSVLLIDLGKGVVAAALIPHLPLGTLPIDPAIVPILCGLAAVIGHVFPVYIGFRGGKGVATGAGMMLAVAPVPMGITLAVFVVAIVASGHVSLGSILGAVCVPVTIGLLNAYGGAHYPPLLVGLTAALAAFVLLTHRSNIARLIHGNERVVSRFVAWRHLFRR
jgi:acyl phosphate:glycerol-3-phosphate acyltransferase